MRFHPEVFTEVRSNDEPPAPCWVAVALLPELTNCAEAVVASIAKASNRLNLIAFIIK